jgi:hypothetical protein
MTPKKIRGLVEKLWTLRHPNVLPCYGYAETKGFGDYGAIISPVSTCHLKIHCANGIQWRENGDSKRYLFTDPPPLQRVGMVRNHLLKGHISHPCSSMTWLKVFSICIIATSLSFTEI